MSGRWSFVFPAAQSELLLFTKVARWFGGGVGVSGEEGVGGGLGTAVDGVWVEAGGQPTFHEGAGAGGLRRLAAAALA